jgi:hypothetical protein
MRTRDHIAGTIGKKDAAEFMAFASMMDRVVTPDQVRLNPMKAALPDSADTCYLTTSMLLTVAKESDLKGFSKYAKRLDEIDPIFSGLLFTDLHNKFKARMSGDPTFNDWLKEHQNLFVA